VEVDRAERTKVSASKFGESRSEGGISDEEKVPSGEVISRVGVPGAVVVFLRL
jgi:hypothetical protein